jgi:fatty-acyl-CoA synthase
VIAVPHEKWGERPLACVVINPGSELDADDLRAHLSTIVAKWWVPEQIVFLDELPKTPVGKINKIALRAQVLAS